MSGYIFATKGRDHPRRRIEMKFCTVGGLQMILLRFEIVLPAALREAQSTGIEVTGQF